MTDILTHPLTAIMLWSATVASMAIFRIKLVRGDDDELEAWWRICIVLSYCAVISSVAYVWRLLAGLFS